MGLFGDKKRNSQQRPSLGSISVSSLLSIPESGWHGSRSPVLSRTPSPTSRASTAGSVTGSMRSSKSPSSPQETRAPDDWLLELEDDLALFEPADARLPRPSLRNDPEDDDDDDFPLSVTQPRAGSNLGDIARRLNQSLGQEPAQRQKAAKLATKTQALSTSAHRPKSYLAPAGLEIEAPSEPEDASKPKRSLSSSKRTSSSSLASVEDAPVELDTSKILAAAERALRRASEQMTSYEGQASWQPSLSPETVEESDLGEAADAFDLDAVSLTGGQHSDTTSRNLSRRTSQSSLTRMSMHSSSSSLNSTGTTASAPVGTTAVVETAPSPSAFVPLRRHRTAPGSAQPGHPSAGVTGDAGLSQEGGLGAFARMPSDPTALAGRSFSIAEHRKTLQSASSRGSVADYSVLLKDIETQVEFEKSVSAARRLARMQKREEREQSSPGKGEIRVGKAPQISPTREQFGFGGAP